MQITDGVVTLILPDDLVWIDEHEWLPVSQTKKYSLTGALVLQSSAKQTGRPITLRSAAEDQGWVTRAQLNQLRQFASVPGKQVSLTLIGGRVFTVVFRHEETQPIIATSLNFTAQVPDASEFFTVTLKFLQVD
jgi:hypothetical protein